MNILVIGNGFDLAHGLPTKYTDFLELVETFKNLIKTPAIMKTGGLINTAKPKYKYLDKLLFEELELRMEFQELIINNIWLEYFFQCDMHGNENWIDFESEISEVIKSIDNDMKDKGLYEKIVLLSNKFFNNKYTNNTTEYLTAMYKDEQKKIEKEPILFKELRDRLITDLGRLIRLFEIYLADYIEPESVKLLILTS